MGVSLCCLVEISSLAGEGLSWSRRTLPGGELYMSKLPITYRRAMVASWDALSWLLALVLFITIRYDFQLSEARWTAILGYTLAATLVTVAGGYGFHLYLGRSRVGSYAEATSLAGHVAVIAVVLGLVFSLIPAFPHGVGLLVPPLALLFMGFGRWAYRGLERDWKRNPRNQANVTARTTPAAIVYGAGEDGHDVARLVDHAAEPPYRILGFIDDDEAMKYRRIRSYRWDAAPTFLRLLVPLAPRLSSSRSAQRPVNSSTPSPSSAATPA